MTLSPFSTTWRTDVVRKVNELRTDVTQLQADVAALQAEVAASQWFWADFLTMRSQVTDRVDLLNNFYGDPNDLLTYTSPSPKYVLNDAGVMVLGTTLRTDHDAAGNPLGLLNEPQRTNFYTYSEQIDNAAWTKGRVTISANTANGPDGTMVADKAVENTDNNTHVVQQTYTTTAGTTYYFSAMVKPDGRDFLRCVISSNQFPSTGVVRFNLLTGAITEQGAVFGGAGTIALPNGWFRVWFFATADKSASGVIGMRLATTGTGGTDTYAGDGVSGILFAGVQLEAGSSLTSYIKTEASQVTRNVDDITIPLASFPWNGGNGVLELNGVAVTPVTSGSNLSISGTAFAVGETHIESLTWQPLP